MEVRTPEKWGVEIREEVRERKRGKHGAKSRVDAKRKVRRGITMNGCTRGLGESTLWVARAGARLWWVGNKWEVRDWRPFAQTSLPRRLAANGKHTAVAEGNQSVERGRDGRKEHIYRLRGMIGGMKTFKKKREGYWHHQVSEKIEGMNSAVGS